MKRASVLFLAMWLISLPVIAQKLKKTGSGITVAVVSTSEGQLASFEAPAEKQHPKGPYVGVWVAGLKGRWISPERAPQTRDGQLISGFKFYGWLEGDAAKVLVLAQVNEKTATYAATDGKRLREVVLDTYVIKPGQSVRIREMAGMGVKPLELRVTRIRQ